MYVEPMKSFTAVGHKPVAEASMVRIEEALVRAKRVVELLEKQKQDLTEGQQVDWGFFGDASRCAHTLGHVLGHLGDDFDEEMER